MFVYLILWLSKGLQRLGTLSVIVVAVFLLGEVRGSSPPLFADVSEAAGVHASHRANWDPEGRGEGYLGVGQAWGDYDNDGLLDLYVTGNRDLNVLYRNNGDGTFAVSSFATQVSLPGAVSGGAVWADYDNDGWRDLYVLNFGANVLFKNDAGRGFKNVTEEAGVGNTGKGESATWGDYDNDGYLDLYVVNWSCLPECDPENVNLSRDRLYRNNADGTFTDVTDLLAEAKTLGAGFAASFGDYDNDGDLDLYVVNDKMANPIGNVMWRNDGPGCGGWCFVDASEETGTDAVLHSMGLASGDYDNDSDLDLYVSNMMSPMMLMENTGLGTFNDVTQGAGVGVNPPGNAVGWGTAFFDYDNDGLLDLYLAASGMRAGPPGFYGGSAPDMEDFHHPYPNALFRNNGDGSFSDVSGALAANDKPTMGLAYADYDNDGDVDFVQGNWNEGYRLYRNERATKGRWLNVHLIGGGSVNRDAVGARVYVTDRGGRTQMREVSLGSSLGAGHDPRLHFGLGQAEIDRVTVVWPGGLKQTFRDVPTNQFWTVTYQNGTDDAGVATDWFELAQRLVRDTPGFSPPVASRAFGYLGVTLYEAVMPGMAGYRSLAGQLNGLGMIPQPPSSETLHWPTVTNSALSTITRHLFGPAGSENAGRVEALEAKFARRFRTELDSDVFDRSVAWGQRVAETIYAWSLTDGGHEGYARNTTAYRPPTASGLWVSTPPEFGAALQPTWGDNRPFVVAKDGCPVVPPLAYSEDPASAFYADALEVHRTVGALTPQQREIALFWADNPLETATPPGHWLSILTRILREGGYGLERAGEAYAKLGVALADSFIACWRDKYRYNVLRPVSYIQRVIDPAWNIPKVTDPVVTPPFPEYPSGHSVQSAAAAAVLTALFGPVPFTDHTHHAKGLEPRRFPSFWAAAEEAAISRLYGGIHFRAAIEQGLAQGRCIGERVNALQFGVR